MQLRTRLHRRSNQRANDRNKRVAVGAIALVLLGGLVGTAAAATTAVEHVTNHTTFVPITPCRLIDTRPQNDIGDRQTPLGPNETYVQEVVGHHGNCEIPYTASGVALNATAVTPTAASHATFFPADEPLPTASNLNWVAGAPPTPNKVDVQLSQDGELAIRNAFGHVDLVVDVTGYYSSSLLASLIGKTTTAAEKPAVIMVADTGDAVNDVENWPTVIASVTLSPEAAGKVTLQATAGLRATTAGAEMRCGIFRDTETVVDEHMYKWEAAGTNPYVGQVFSPRTATVDGTAPVTFNMICYRVGVSQVDLVNAHLSATYVQGGVSFAAMS